jgi:shikimate dehydrogenase
VLHRAAYAALGLDWTYDAIDCGVAELPTVVAERADWAGFSATMPLKRALLDVAAIVEPTALEVGAANTLLPGAAGWTAANTDVAGIRAALLEQHGPAGPGTVLGAGGTAQAALVALRSFGITDVAVLVRDRSRGTALLDTAERIGVRVRLADLAADAAELGAPLVVSTLPPGAADGLAGRDWRPDQTVLDVVYDPWPTPLAARAQGAGVPLVGGLDLLVHQAVHQVELMTGLPGAPLAQMRAAGEAALAARTSHDSRAAPA